MESRRLGKSVDRVSLVRVKLSILSERPKSYKYKEVEGKTRMGEVVGSDWEPRTWT